MKVTEKDLVGKIKDFPIEVVQRMCEEQVRQGNDFDPIVFQEEEYADECKGGFDWDESEEGFDFWISVIDYEKFDVFFEKYPKQKESEYPKEMMVSNNNTSWHKRVVVSKVHNKYICCNTIENIEDYKGDENVLLWKYAKEIPQIVNVTLKDIAEWKGVSVEQIKIEE